MGLSAVQVLVVVMDILHEDSTSSGVVFLDLVAVVISRISSFLLSLDFSNSTSGCSKYVLLSCLLGLGSANEDGTCRLWRPRTSFALKLITLQATELTLVLCFVLLVRTLSDGCLNGEGVPFVSW
jgi:hypothetical protein